MSSKKRISLRARVAREVCFWSIFALDSRPLFVQAPLPIHRNSMSEVKNQSTKLRDHLREQISFWRSDLGVAKLSFSQVKKRQQLEKIWEDDSLWSEVHQTLENLLRYQGSIDTLISQSSLRWKLGRMGNVDRAVLRLGTYELCFHENLPARALLNEAVELGKRYGSAESGRFINGVLDRVAQDLARIEKRSESGGISVSVVHRKR